MSLSYLFFKERKNSMVPILYIFFFLLLSLLLFTLYIRVKYGFWAVQPVFHGYDFHYMFCKNRVIQENLPEKNKYTNFKNIETNVFNELIARNKKLTIKRWIDLIRIHYLKNKENVFLPKEENVLPYFVGHNSKSFITFYYEDVLLNDVAKTVPISDKKMISVITGRPMHIIINNNSNNNNNTKENPIIFDAYYVDYLCVDKAHRKKGIAPQMIQTHHYNQRHLNKNILVSLFKREEELTGIVPLCFFNTFGFSVAKWSKPPSLHAAYQWLNVSETTYHLLHDFMKLNSNLFDITILSEPANIIELIKTKNIFISALQYKGDIIAAYFYRKTCVFVEKGLEVLTCIGSINQCDGEDIFIQGFKISFWDIAAKNHFGFAAIENISHNDVIIDNIKKKTKPLITSPTAYFFYNYICSTFQAKKVFILN